MKTLLTTAGLCCALGAQTIAQNPASTLPVGAVGAREAMRTGSSESFVDRGGVPSNGANFCGDAPAITGFGLFPWDNTAATVDGLPSPLCAKDGGAQIDRDLWWRWTSPISGEVTISTCDLTTVDTEIAIYGPGSACPPGESTLIFCDDQNCGAQTEITFLAVAGQEYVIRLGNWDGFDGGGGVAGGAGEFLLSAPGVSPCEPAQCQSPDNTDGVQTGDSSRAADNFTALVDGYVSFVCVLGDYNSTDPTPPSGDSFSVAYYEDAGGIPGRLIAFFGAADLSVEGPAPTGQFVFGNLPQFQHRIQHQAVPVLQGVTYWVEVTNSGTLSGWYWTLGAEGDGLSYRDLNGLYEPGDAISFDLAYCVGPLDTCPLDVDGDGDIDFGDLNAVVSEFNTICP